MTEPRRLLESTAGECDTFEADLLRAGRGDAMSGASKRALVAAALGGTLAATAAAPANLAAAAKVGTGVFAKWMMIAIVGGVLAGGAGLLLLAPAPAGTAAPATPSATPPRPAASIPTAAIASAMAAATAPDPAPSALPAAPSASALPVSTAPPAPPAPWAAPAHDAADVAAEAALLDSAREAVARRDGAAALSVLAEHARAFPRPVLADEAFVLRAEALSAQGDSARLRALATPWLASHPTSPYAPRVRRALAQTSPASSGAPLP